MQVLAPSLVSAWGSALLSRHKASHCLSSRCQTRVCLCVCLHCTRPAVGASSLPKNNSSRQMTVSPTGHSCRVALTSGHPRRLQPPCPVQGEPASPPQEPGVSAGTNTSTLSAAKWVHSLTKKATASAS